MNQYGTSRDIFIKVGMKTNRNLLKACSGYVIFKGFYLFDPDADSDERLIGSSRSP